MSTDTPHIAAVVYDPGEHIETLLEEAARELRRQGVRVGGLVQRSVRDNPEDRCRIELESVGSGTVYPLTQALGSQSQSCALDPAKLADASMVIREAISAAADLVLVNKFGAQEAAGGGLRDEMLEIAVAGIPLLTSVPRRFLDEWHAFMGDGATLLPMSLDAIVCWWKGIRQSSAIPH